MESLETIIARAALAMDLAEEDLRAIFGQGEQKTYQAGTWLFHESTPRDWAGIIQDGEIEIVRGLHGSITMLARLGPGAMLAEGALLDNTPHTTGAFTRYGVVVWQVPRAAWEAARQTSPAVFYRVVARVAEGISMRLRYASEQLAGTAGAEQLIGSVRREHDLLGERELPSTAYYGVQTLRALENFPLSGIPLKNFAHFVDALAFVKKAAAQANCQLGVLDQDKMQAICAACDEILAGQWHEQFVVDMFQGGAGTSTNMNANEVIANRALSGHSVAQRYDGSAERTQNGPGNQSCRICRCAQNGPYRKPGCCPDDPGPGIWRLCGDDWQRHAQPESRCYGAA